MSRVLRAVLLLSALWFSACAPEGPTAFVTFNLAPNSNCIYTPQSTGNLFFPIGRYDIAAGGNALSTGCASPYVVHLLVNSYLRPNSDPALGRAEPDILQLHNAEVRLTDITNRTILFDRVKPALPNPFLVNTNNSLFPASGTTPSMGIAAVQVIPTAYASQLDTFAANNAQILAQIQVFGTTTGEVDINFKPFVYPIELCSGCLTLCETKLTAASKTRMDIVKDKCDDNAHADNRVCIDPDC